MNLDINLHPKREREREMLEEKTTKIKFIVLILYLIYLPRRKADALALLNC